MKKTSIILTSILCSSFVFGLASCGDGGEGGEDPTIYKISYDENANYEIIDLAKKEVTFFLMLNQRVYFIRLAK